MASNSYRSDPARAAQLAVHLAKHALQHGDAAHANLIAAVVVRMQAAARSAKRQEERACNVPMTEAEQWRAEARMARSQGAINEALAAMFSAGVAPKITLGGDPRGACGTLYIPNMPGDGWGGADGGFPIY
jgi:hypothetical protein